LVTSIHSISNLNIFSSAQKSKHRIREERKTISLNTAQDSTTNPVLCADQTQKSVASLSTSHKTPFDEGNYAFLQCEIKNF
jgi:hypothetical protein